MGTQIPATTFNWLTESKMRLLPCTDLGANFSQGRELPRSHCKTQPWKPASWLHQRMLPTGPHCLWPLHHQVRPLKVTGWRNGRGEYKRTHQPGPLCFSGPTLMQANTSTCQPGGLLPLWTEGLGLQASWQPQVCQPELGWRSTLCSPPQLLTLPSPNQG